MCLSQSRCKNKVWRTFSLEDYVRSCDEADLRVGSKINCLISLKELLVIHRLPVIARNVKSVVTFSKDTKISEINNYQKTLQSNKTEVYLNSMTVSVLFDIVGTMYHVVINMQSNKTHKVF